MASLIRGKRKICPGVYYEMSPANRGLAVNIRLTIKWYGYLFLFLKKYSADSPPFKNIFWVPMEDRE